jgi:hypothetical protein
MVRLAAKVDGNSAEIIGYFRKFGCSVLPMHTPKNAVDCAIGLNKRTVLVEIKDGRKTASQRKLTKGESRFHEGWKGAICVVQDLEDVIALVKALEK